VPESLRQYHVGKEGYPTRTYQVVVNHTRRILSVTPGLPGATSDKTVAMNDLFLEEMRANPVYTQFRFELYDSAGDAQPHKGLFLISYMGYQRWKIFQQPIKFPASDAECVFSKRVESIRKDVEDTFGGDKGSVSDSQVSHKSSFRKGC